ncbi:MAG: hypothetical protein KBC96_03965 [Armatimonadetes bacterium]|nr:hypothetical protein [Armatimonadota bacterium]
MAAKKERLEFAIASGMPLGPRTVLIACLMFAGFAIQLTVSVLLGWLSFLAGCLLGIIRGRSNAPKIQGKGEWANTTIEELEQIEKLSIRIRSWRERTDAFRATSCGGCVMTLIGLLALFISTFLIGKYVDRVADGYEMFARMFLPAVNGGLIASVWVMDVLTVFVPIWFAGGISAWEPPELPRKAKYLLDIHRSYKLEPELEFAPSLHVQKKDDRAIPTDARLMIKFRGAPKEFLGVQVQISLNSVQGTNYPYCYAVILAKKEFGLVRRAQEYLKDGDQTGLLGLFKSENDRKEMAHQKFADSIVETESQTDVDVVVIRQVTVGRGYHTTEEQAIGVVSDALDLARLVLKT